LAIALGYMIGKELVINVDATLRRLASNLCRALQSVAQIF
jgi:hypothetical protein